MSASRHNNGEAKSQVENHSLRKGAAYGAVAGSIAGLGFVGIMLWLPMIFHMPTGAFIMALGSLVTGQLDDYTAMGFAGFGIMMAQSISVAVIFGLVTTRDRFYPSHKGKGIAMGIAAGIIAFLVLYLPLNMTVFPATLSQMLNNYPPVQKAELGGQDFTMALPSAPVGYMTGIILFGLLAYTGYGFFMGGIVTAAYSVYHFDLQKKEEEKNR